MSIYPNCDALNAACEQLRSWAFQQAEYGSDGKRLDTLIEQAAAGLISKARAIAALPVDKALAAREPGSLSAIRALRAGGPRRLLNSLPSDEIMLDKLAGAYMARFAGCILGVMVEGWSIARMKGFAEACGMSFPPIDYWEHVEEPDTIMDGVSPYRNYTRQGMNGTPVDDDTAYTLLSLLILEKYGTRFTTADVAQAWADLVPFGWTAEGVALKNISAGVPVEEIGLRNNPYQQFIGADIRSDGYAYACAGYPERAAEMAYHDAMLSHRRNGVYGSMFFAAAQAAAFAIDNPIEAIHIGLTEIPRECGLYKDIVWALGELPHIHNYQQARDAVDGRFPGMPKAHTNHNACLTVFGLSIGGHDFTKMVSELVAMGLDNDCTAATAGSILGAIVGKKGIDQHWYANFNNASYSYLKGYPVFQIDDVLARFLAVAKKIAAE